MQELAAVPGVDYAGWLSPRVLLIVGSFPVDKNAPEVSLVSGDQSLSLEVRAFSYARPAPAGVAAHADGLLAVHFPSLKHGAEPVFDLLKIRTADRAVTLAPADLVNLQTLVREALAGLDPKTRTEIAMFLASTPSLDRRLSKSLFAVREALRERLPYSLLAREEPRCLHIDAILAVDEKSFYLRGWTRDAEASLARLTVVSPEGERVELAERVFRYPRPDLDELYGNQDETELGFLGYFELAGPSLLPEGWVIEMQNVEGSGVEVNAPPIIRDRTAVRDVILADVDHACSTDQDLLPNHIFPAISRLQERRRQRVEVASVIRYGTPDEMPEVSIVVPLYERVDFLEQQLAQFVHDAQIAEADLIYVLDSPELAEGLKDRAAWLSQLYRVPFRVIILRRNVGFAAASNVGASLARGRLLLLLNSDVLPDRPGWLKAMVSFYDATPRIGALAPKLLYEDDSLQHAGLYFYRKPNSLWTNEHYFKGLHRSIPAANLARPVPAVTAACMMIDRHLYEQLGGLRDIYVQGSFEDSDLCLRLSEAGYENWYFPDAELYHLEGQSYPAQLRGLTGRYNAWLHTHLWDASIERLMTRHAPTRSFSTCGKPAQESK